MKKTLDSIREYATLRQDKTRQDKTRQDKTRQDKTRQDKTRRNCNLISVPQSKGVEDI
jgi:hypothetical protein